MKGLRRWGAISVLILFSSVHAPAQVALLDACYTARPEPIPVGVSVTLDGGCSRSNLGGRVMSYAWSLGDGQTATGAVVEHVYSVGGAYRVALTVRDDLGNTASIDGIVNVKDTILPFEDRFERIAGAVGQDWTVFTGVWTITPEGRLRGRSSGESLIYAGAPSGLIVGDVTIEFDIEFLSAPLDGVGRNASVFLYAAEPTSRWSTTGYSVSWIDRAGDAGLGLHRWTGGNVEELALSKSTAPQLQDPPRTWTITVEGPRIQIYGDGALIIDVEDHQVPREGYLGLWTNFNGQDVLFDNFTARSGVFPPVIDEIIPCAQVDVNPVLTGDAVTLDASCSRIPDDVVVTGYSWDFGDGTTGTEQVVEHTYESAGEFVVELTIDHDGGTSVTTTLTVSVDATVELPYRAGFDQPAGTEIDGWTVSSGKWSITDDERLEVRTTISEAHIWIGDPPIWFEGDLTMEFEVEFLSHRPPTDGIGKHAGVFFYAKEPTARARSESYDVWWIDRDQDFGLGLHEWPLRFLSPGTFDRVPEPPTSWRVEVSGPTIRVFGDDELLIEADDETRRGGYIGFWAYSNHQVVRFDNLCIVEGPFVGKPDCAPGPPRFVRGDTNGDGGSDITDGVTVLLYLFAGVVVPCLDALDTNDDGGINIADGIFTLSFLFGGGQPPPAPLMDCGEDPTEDELSCDRFDPCL